MMRLTVRSREAGICGRGAGTDSLLESKMEDANPDKPSRIDTAVSADTKKVSMSVDGTYDAAQSSPKTESKMVL